MKKRNAAGEKEMAVHIRTVKGAKKELTREASKLGRKISGKMTFALSQDAKILKDMKKADKK